MKKYANMKVHPRFKSWIKSIAADEDITIIELTKNWGKKKNEKKIGFDFKI